MKHRSLFPMALLALPVFAFGQMAQVPADTAGSPCNRHYEAAIKFMVDTPVVHPFTVSAEGTRVLISKGNLQYCPSRDEWRFALNQWDRVGNGKQAITPSGLNQNEGYGITTVFYDSTDYSTKDPSTKSGYKEISGIPCNNLLVSKDYEGWIDLFAWGTSGHGKKSGDSLAIYFYPYDLNNETVDGTYNTYGYGPSYGGKRGEGAKNNNFDTASGTNRYFDWGYANNIREYTPCTHTDGVSHKYDSTMYRPGVWRTLTSAEWTYLLTTRVVAGSNNAFSYVRLKYGDNATDTVTGMVIYPDDFSFADAGVDAISFGATRPTEIDIDSWRALESFGCVFLPNSYCRRYNSDQTIYISEQSIGLYGSFWSASTQNRNKASRIDMSVYAPAMNTNNYNGISERSLGFSVRLAQDL